MITFQREGYDQLIEDIKPVLPTHWREMAQRQDEIPLDPDYEFYRKAMAADMCRIYTARSDGELVGYCIIFITRRHPHYNHSWAKDDTIWIKSDHRMLGAATGLFDLFEADLRKDGPIVIQIETRFGHEALNRFLERRGYSPTGAVLGKRFA